jgi:uncharacterized protein YuzE
MASQDDTLDLDYDEQNDILYASLGSPQAALSHEIVKDIWLDYVPPHRAVVGMTILSFSQHFAIPDKTQLLVVAKTAVQDLLRRYPSVPSGEEVQQVQMAVAENPYVQTFTSATYGTRFDRTTMYVGPAPLMKSPDIQSSQVS